MQSCLDGGKPNGPDGVVQAEVALSACPWVLSKLMKVVGWSEWDVGELEGLPCSGILEGLVK